MFEALSPSRPNLFVLPPSGRILSQLCAAATDYAPGSAVSGG